MKEIEAKYPLSSSQYNEMKEYLFKLSSYKKYTLFAGKTIILDNSYFDTAERTLTAQRCFLRLRKQEDENILSFKKNEGQRLNVVIREKSTSIVPNFEINNSDTEPLKKAKEITGDSQLREILKMKTERNILYFKYLDFLCEARLDNVVVLEPRSDHFHEFEIELKKGDFDSFRELLEQINKDFGIELSRQSKFEKALEIPEQSL